MIIYCPGFTRCPVKVIVPFTGASSLSGFAFSENDLTAAVPWNIPFFGSNVARTSALPMEPGNVAVG
jgi:hypothetical protein